MTKPSLAHRASWLVVGSVLLAVAVGALVDGRMGGADVWDAPNLTAPSGLVAWEWMVCGALALFRLASPRWRWLPALLPLVDLPLIGFAIAACGGESSPLAPTFPLVYVAALLFLRDEHASSLRTWGWQVVVGYALVLALAWQHDRARLADAERACADGAVTRLDTLLRGRPGADEPSSDSVVLIDAADDIRRRASEPSVALLSPLPRVLLEGADIVEVFVREVKAVATPHRDQSPSVGAMVNRLDSAAGQLFADERTVIDTWRQERSNATERLARLPADEVETVRPPLNQLDQTFESLHGVFKRSEQECNFLVVRMQAFEKARAALDAGHVLRLSIQAFLIVAFAVLLARLRDYLRQQIREAKEREVRREIDAREREKDNWIALTAGLTHGLGNDILAYDIHLRDLLDDLSRPDVEPETLRTRLTFLHDSNRGRLGFIQFLEAFARQRREEPGDAPATPRLPHRDIDLPDLLQRVRRHLAAVETADLPPAGLDPAADRKLALLRDLPLEIDLRDPKSATLAHGHRGVLEFFAYELLKNALRSASGTRHLHVTLEPSPVMDSDGIRLTLTNDVQVDATRGTCAACGREGTLRSVRRWRHREPCCPDCFEQALEEMLESAFEPGRGGGTGLGLFLIRYFLSTYYRGAIAAHVEDPTVPLVSFTLDLPAGSPAPDAETSP